MIADFGHWCVLDAPQRHEVIDKAPQLEMQLPDVREDRLEKLSGKAIWVWARPEFVDE